MEIFDKYKKCGFVPFSFDIDVEKNTKKKIVKNIPTYGIYNSYNNKKNINIKKNGHGLKMGIEYNKKFLIGLDIDNKAGPYDGLLKWKELLLKHYKNDDIDIINTPTQQTGTGGYHYLFLVSKEQLNIIGCSITGLYINNSDDKYKIDIKATNQFLICEPSNYDGKYYKWIKDPAETKILNIPEWIFKIIVKHKEHKPPVKIKETKPTQDEQPTQEIINKIDDNIYKYLNCINTGRYDDYDDWIYIGRVLKNINIPYEYYLTKSRASKNFKSDEDVYKKWLSFK